MIEFVLTVLEIVTILGLYKVYTDTKVKELNGNIETLKSDINTLVLQNHRDMIEIVSMERELT